MYYLIIDIALICIFVFTIVMAAKRGFFITLFELAAYIVSVIAAKILSASLAPEVFRQYLYAPINQKLIASLGEIGTKDYTKQIESALNSIPESLNGLMQMIGIDRDSLISQVSQSELSGKNVAENVMEKLVTPAATAIVQTMLFVVLSIVILVVLRIVVRLMNGIIKKLPAIKQVNSSLGAVLGAVKGLILVIIVSLLIGMIASLTSSQTFIDAVDSSLVIKAVKGFLTSISGYTY